MLPENKTTETAKQVQTADLNTEEGEKESGGLQMRSPELVLLASSGQAAQSTKTATSEAPNPEQLARLIKSMITGKGTRPISELPAVLRQLDSAAYEQLCTAYMKLYQTSDPNGRPITRDLLIHFHNDKGSPLWREILVEMTRLEEPDGHSPNPSAGFVDGNLDHKVKGSDGETDIGLLGTCLVNKRFSVDIIWHKIADKTKRTNGKNLMMQVLTPSGEVIQRFGPDTYDVHFTPTEPGVYDVIIMDNARYSDTDASYYDLARGYVVAHSAEGIKRYNLRGTTPVAYEDLKTRMLVQDLAMGGYGVKDQQVGPEYLSSSLDNPLRPQWETFGGYKPQTSTYKAHGICEGDRLQARWYVALEDKPEIRQQYKDKDLSNATDESRNRLRVPPGYALFHMGFEHSLSKDFQIRTPGHYMIYAEEYTAAEGGDPTGKVATYHHSALNDQQDKSRESFKAYAGNVASRMEQIQPGKEIPIRAVHANDKGERTQLTMYIGPARTGGGLMLVDATPGAREMDYQGKDIASLLEEFRSRASSYPQGKIFFEIPQNASGIAPGVHDIPTKGESDMGALAKTTGWASFAAAGAGMLSLLTPAGPVLAPLLFTSASALGLTSASASIADNMDNASVDKTALTVDVLSVAMSLIGLGMAGAAVRGGGNALLGGTRMGRYVLYTNLGLEGAAGLVMTYDSVLQIKAISEKDGMSPEAKRNAIVRLVATLAITGGLFVMSLRDMQALKNGGHKLDADPSATTRGLSQLDPKERIAVFQSIISKVKARIGAETHRFEVKYKDIEMADIAIQGRQLGLSDREIEDFIFVGQRSDKPLEIAEVHRQMKNWATIVRTREFPYLFKDKKTYNTFKDEIRNTLKRYRIPFYDVNIQGSSLRTEAAHDIDIAVFVNKEEFDRLVVAARRGIEMRNAGNDPKTIGKREKLLKNLEKQVPTGRLNSFIIDAPSGLPSFNSSLSTACKLIDNKGINLSVMLNDNKFNISPLLPFDK